MSKINETNYPRRTQANYADTDMLVIQAAGGNTYTTRLEDMREDYKATLAPTLSALQDDINENLATIEEGSTASKVYAKGDYLVFGGKLCRVTSTSIAAGATLTIGTNIELAPVGDELKTLSSDLVSYKVVRVIAAGETVTIPFSDIFGNHLAHSALIMFERAQRQGAYLLVKLGSTQVLGLLPIVTPLRISVTISGASLVVVNSDASYDNTMSCTVYNEIAG